MFAWCSVLPAEQWPSFSFLSPQIFPQLCVALWLRFGSPWVLTVKPWSWALDIPFTRAGLGPLFAFSAVASSSAARATRKHLARTVSTMGQDPAPQPTLKAPMYKWSWDFLRLYHQMFQNGWMGFLCAPGVALACIFAQRLTSSLAEDSKKQCDIS